MMSVSTRCCKTTKDAPLGASVSISERLLSLPSIANVRQHPLGDSNPCYQDENLAS